MFCYFEAHVDTLSSNMVEAHIATSSAAALHIVYSEM